MGRAIVREPAAFLMDEPLSNLDAKLRVQMRAEIARLQHDLGVTTIYVTHDQVEAMTMGDRVAVMRKGELQQVATPQELYDRPVNLFVGGFIGSPAMNLLEATLERANGDLVAMLGSQELALDERDADARPGAAEYAGREVDRSASGPRISRTRPSTSDATPRAAAHGAGELREALGSEIMVHFRVDAPAGDDGRVRELAQDAGTEATRSRRRRPGRDDGRPLRRRARACARARRRRGRCRHARAPLLRSRDRARHLRRPTKGSGT